MLKGFDKSIGKNITIPYFFRLQKVINNFFITYSVEALTWIQVF
jgi:hypothetical protein